MNELSREALLKLEAEVKAGDKKAIGFVKAMRASVNQARRIHGLPEFVVDSSGNVSVKPTE